MSDPIPPKERELSTPAVSPPPDPRPPRRIPRGRTGRTDPIKVLHRTAVANTRRIRGMMQRVRPHDRRILHELRIRLVQIIVVISKNPEKVRTGTFDEVGEIMAQARDLYGRAPKLNAQGKARAEPLQLGPDPVMRQTKAKKTPSIIGAVTSPQSPPDDRRFDRDGWQTDTAVTVDVAPEGAQLAADMATAGSSGNAAFGK